MKTAFRLFLAFAFTCTHGLAWAGESAPTATLEHLSHQFAETGEGAAEIVAVLSRDSSQLTASLDTILKPILESSMSPQEKADRINLLQKEVEVFGKAQGDNPSNPQDARAASAMVMGMLSLLLIPLVMGEPPRRYDYLGEMIMAGERLKNGFMLAVVFGVLGGAAGYALGDSIAEMLPKPKGRKGVGNLNIRDTQSRLSQECARLLLPDQA